MVCQGLAGAAGRAWLPLSEQQGQLCAGEPLCSYFLQGLITRGVQLRHGMIVTAGVGMHFLRAITKRPFDVHPGCSVFNAEPSQHEGGGGNATKPAKARSIITPPPCRASCRMASRARPSDRRLAAARWYRSHAMTMARPFNVK